MPGGLRIQLVVVVLNDCAFVREGRNRDMVGASTRSLECPCTLGQQLRVGVRSVRISQWAGRTRSSD